MDLFESLKSYLPKQEVDALKQSISLSRTHGLILNPAKVKPTDFERAYPHVTKVDHVPFGYRYDAEEYPFGKNLLFDAGAYYIQDPSAMLVSAFLEPKENARVLDLCAAPGGKTIGLAVTRKDVTILSNDISYPRAKELSGNVERMGLDNVAVTAADFSSCYRDYLEYFDAIILDAPCSGSAMFRKNIEAEKDWTIAKVSRCAGIQKDLLEMATAMLAKGGRLLYSTCSFSKEEDIDQVLALVSAHSDMEFLSLPDDPSFYHHPDCAKAIYLFPHRYIGEGQFLALLQKKGESSPTLAKKSPCPKEGKDLAERYHLSSYDFKKHGDCLYALNKPMKTDHLPLLRYGVKLLGERGPDFALARSLPSSLAIPLNEKQAHDYLLGLTFPLEKENGYYAVSYAGLPLGFVKVSQGVAKNHYPKGLRRDYPLPLLLLDVAD